MTIYPVPKPVRVPRERHRLKHKKRMKAKNAKRGGHAFPKNVDEAYREWIRALPCILALRPRSWEPTAPWNGNAGISPTILHVCNSPTQACHVKTRGSGGKDRNNLYPGCSGAHDEQHAIGIRAFQKQWGVDLKAIAHRLTELYEAEVFPCP